MPQIHVLGFGAVVQQVAVAVGDHHGADQLGIRQHTGPERQPLAAVEGACQPDAPDDLGLGEILPHFGQDLIVDVAAIHEEIGAVCQVWQHRPDGLRALVADGGQVILDALILGGDGLAEEVKLHPQGGLGCRFPHLVQLADGGQVIHTALAVYEADLRKIRQHGQHRHQLVGLVRLHGGQVQGNGIVGDPPAQHIHAVAQLSLGKSLPQALQLPGGKLRGTQVDDSHGRKLRCRIQQRLVLPGQLCQIQAVGLQSQYGAADVHRGNGGGRHGSFALLPAAARQQKNQQQAKDTSFHKAYSFWEIPI